MALKNRIKKLENKVLERQDRKYQIILHEDGELWTLDGSTLTQEEYDALNPEQIINPEFIHHEDALEHLD